MKVEALTATVDEMDAAFRKGENVTADSVLDRRNVMEDHDIFVDLMDHPVTFPIVRELIGDFIQLEYVGGDCPAAESERSRVSAYGRWAGDADYSGQSIEFAAASENPLFFDGS